MCIITLLIDSSSLLSSSFNFSQSHQPYQLSLFFPKAWLAIVSAETLSFFATLSTWGHLAAAFFFWFFSLAMTASACLPNYLFIIWRLTGLFIMNIVVTICILVSCFFGLSQHRCFPGQARGKVDIFKSDLTHHQLLDMLQK